MVSIAAILMLLTAVPAYNAETAAAAAGRTAIYKGPQSSFSYKKYSTQTEYMRDLRWRMERVYDGLEAYTDDSKIVPVPGIIKTYTVNGKEVDQKEYEKQLADFNAKYAPFVVIDAEGLNVMEFADGEFAEGTQLAYWTAEDTLGELDSMAKE